MNSSSLAHRLDTVNRLPPPGDDWPDADMSVLSGGRTAPPVMPSTMLGRMWPLICDLAEGAGCPVDYVAVGVLAVSASLVGAARRIQPFESSPQWQEPCILWIAPVGDPSSNKSPALDAATLPLRGMEQETADEHRQELMQYETALERAKAERSRWQDQVKAAAKEGAATPPMPASAELPDEPERRRMLVQDATPEAMGDILAGNPNGTLHLRDELAGWLLSFERYSPGGREFWLEAYGGRPHVIDRKSQKKPLAIPFNGVSVIGGIQPEKLADCLLSIADDGLVPRFLWAWPDPVPYHRPRTIADVAMLERVYRRLDSVRPLQPSDGKEEPKIILLDDAAADLFESWITQCSAETGAAASMYKSFVGKLRGMVLRLALVSHMMEWAIGSEYNEPERVSLATMDAVLEFVDNYAKPMARRVFGDAALPPSERNAAMLARYILQAGKLRINAREVRRTSGIPSLKQPHEVDAAISVLIEAGWLKADPSRVGGTAGQTKKDYQVNPGVQRFAPS